ncbi:MAG TPA: copper chaperone [Sulfurimonas sp.]|nr:copper chaperone [Sulfurimonas sp.]
MLKTLEVQNLSCGACAETIRTALEIAGFIEVNVNLRKEPHVVTAEIKDDEHLELLKKVLREHGYPLIDDEVDLPDHSNLNFS